MTRTKIGALALLVAVGCKTGGHPKHDDEHGSHDDEHGSHAHGDDGDKANEPGTLRIDPEMLRDLRITTAPVEVRPGGEGVMVLGELGVNENAYAEVGTPMPARIVRLVAAVGDVVKSGQALAELQSVDLGRAHADSSAAKARLDLARKAFERKKQLFADRIVPEREVQEAEAEVSAAEAALSGARAAIDAFGSGARGGGSSRFAVTTPVAGTVIERNTALGQLADPARPLFRVTDLARLWLTVHAFERDAVRVRTGATARVKLPALPERSFSGQVTTIGKTVDVRSRTMPVRVELENADGTLRPGMSATAWLALGDETATVLAVPAAALQRLDDGWHVFLPKGEGEFLVRAVGRGRDLGGEVEILSGLQTGERVVVDGAFLLKAEADKSRGEGEHHHH